MAKVNIDKGLAEMVFDKKQKEAILDFDKTLAKRFCPVKTGKLKNSIKGKIVGNKIIVGTNVDYGLWVERGCFFSENISILTNKGFMKLKYVKVGDLVFTHKRRFKKVLHNFKQKVKGSIGKITINTNKGKKLTVTEEHPFYVKRDGDFVWIKAKNLQLNDEVVVI